MSEPLIEKSSSHDMISSNRRKSSGTKICSSEHLTLQLLEKLDVFRSSNRNKYNIFHSVVHDRLAQGSQQDEINNQSFLTDIFDFCIGVRTM